MKTVNFSKLRFLMLAISVALIATGAVVTVVRGGFNLGIDFQAGLSMRVAVNPSGSESNIENVRLAVDGLGAQVQTIGSDADMQYVIRVSDPGNVDAFATTMSADILESLRDEFGAGAVTELETTFVGPRFSQDLTQNVFILTALALAVILVYIWIRFRLGYAMASITALLHDVAFMVVFIGAFKIEVSTATIAAVLTIIGYSLNDTIVIFDRIRENETIMRESGFKNIVNASITQSLSRTLITSLTTLLAVSAIYIFATGPVQLFALNMIIGVIVGTYSSIFVASPVLMGWQGAARRRKSRRDAERHGTPVATRAAEKQKEATAAQTAVTAADKQRVIDEISRKRASTGSRSASRSQRKKKK